LCQGSCAITTQGFVLFSHISLQTRSDKRELVLINNINQTTISKEEADKLCNPGSGPQPDPLRRQEPLHAVTNQAAPRSWGRTSPAQTPPSPAPNCSFRERRNAFPHPSNPAPRPSVLLGALSLQPHRADTKRANYHTKHTLSGHSKICIVFYLERFSFCVIVKSSVERGKREREKGK